MVFSSSLLDKMAARPPTPPRDVAQDISEAMEFLDDSFEIDRALEKPSGATLAVDTPPHQTPTSSAEPTNNGSGRQTKRVGFSPWTKYHTEPDHKQRTLGDKAALRPLPQNRIQPLKSILKPQSPSASFNGGEFPFNSGSISAHQFESFSQMLELVVHRLAGEGRESRLDAYVALLGTLKAHENIPASDVQVLQDKLSLFMQFIQRDLTAVMAATSTPDTNLTTQALKLLMVFMKEPGLTDSMNNEFRAYVIDRSIEVLEDENSSKAILNHHLGLLAHQKFGLKVVTATRAEKIMKALKDIDNRIKGNGIIGYRLAVYQRFIVQVPSVMIAQLPDWFEHVFHGMLSSFKEIRTRAIDVGTMAGVAFGANSQASKAVLDLLGRSSDSEGSYADYLEKRLLKMTSKTDDAVSKEDCQHAPQIWTVVTLFVRARRPEFHNWRHFKQWLNIFQKFINSGNYHLRFHANLAWNRFVYVVFPDDSISAPMIRLLRQAIVGQLERRAHDKPSRQARLVALGTYYNLLYYSLRPSASAKDLDLFWDEYVVQILNSILVTGQKDAAVACRLVTVLFYGNPPRPWHEDRALEQELVAVEELPRLDSKWVRQRISTTLALVGSCLNTAPWDSALPENSAASKLWFSFLDALAEAGSKEVKASLEHKQAIAAITNHLHSVWMKHLSSLATGSVDKNEWMKRYGFIVSTTMEKLGPLNFSDKILAHNGEADFEVAPTPSHRSRNTGPLISPLQHIVKLLSAESPDHGAENIRIQFLTKMISLGWRYKNTRQLKLEHLDECIQAMQQAPGYEVDAGIQSEIWSVVADLTQRTLKEDDRSISEHRNLSVEYQEVVKILCAPLVQATSRILKITKDLLLQFMEIVKEEAGEGAVVLAITEPLAQEKSALINFEREMVFASVLLEHTNPPRTRRALEQGRKALGRGSNAERRTIDFDPYTHFYSMVVRLLGLCYDGSDALIGPEGGESLGSDLISSLTTSIQKYPLPLSGIFLRKMQEGIALWVEDRNRRLEEQDPYGRTMYGAVLKLWEVVCAAIEALPRTDSALLDALETLVASGLVSRRRKIVNLSVKMWNATFGSRESLEYPPKVERALRKLRPLVELQLPSFPDGEDDEETPSFFDSQDDVEESQHLKPPRATLSVSPGPRLRSRMVSHSPATRSTPRLPSRSPMKQTPRGRLRHENSQIQFEAIESSPASAVESQLLTERQREVSERQRAETATMFPDISSSPKLPGSERKSSLSRLELKKAAKPVQQATTTPKGRQPSLGPMLSYLSSSPTPRSGASRYANRSRIMSDETEMSTPIAVRSLNLAAGGHDPPSSPPKGEEDDNGSLSAPTIEYDRIRDSFEDQEIQMPSIEHDVATEDHGAAHGQEPKDDLPMSDVENGGEEEEENEGNTIVIDSADKIQDEEESEDVVMSDSDTEEFTVEIPSSTAEKQLFAQISNEMNEHTKGTASESHESTEPACEGPTIDDHPHGTPPMLKTADSGDVFVDAPSEQAAENDETEVFVDASQVLDRTSSNSTEAFAASSQQSQTKSQRRRRQRLSSQQKDDFIIEEELEGPDATSTPRQKDVEQSSKHPDTIHVLDSFASTAGTGSSNEGIEDRAVTLIDLDLLAASSPAKPRSPAKKRKGGMIRSKHAKRLRPPSENIPSSAELYDTINKAANNLDDPDILDCIVVSTQRTTTPSPNKVPAPRSRVPTPAAVSAYVAPPKVVALKQEHAPETAESSSSAVGFAIPKKKAGRPRKSTPSTASEASPAPENLLARAATLKKRRSSRLSEVDVEEEDSTIAELTIPATETPAAKRPRTRASQASVRDISRPPSDAESNTSQVKRMSHVEIRSSSTPSPTSAQYIAASTAPEDVELLDTQIPDSGPFAAVDSTPSIEPAGTKRKADVALSEPAKPSSSAESSASGASAKKTTEQVNKRPILKPVSIIDRLKRILADCKSLVLGSQEEREVDDLLFEVRKEVHEAGRRGRGSDDN